MDCGDLLLAVGEANREGGNVTIGKREVGLTGFA